MRFGVAVAVFRRSFRGQRFLVHFIGNGVGFFRGALVIVLVVRFVIFFRVGFLIGVQRFLQLFKLSGLHKSFGHGFDGFGAGFGIGLRFFVLGFDQLLGKRVCLIVG